MYDQTDQRLEYPSYLQEASQLHPSKREQNFLTTMAISALPFCRLRQRHHCLCLHCRSHSRVAKLSGYTWRWAAEQAKTVVPRNQSTTSTTNFCTFGLQPRHCLEQCTGTSSSTLLTPDPSNTSIWTVAWVSWMLMPQGWWHPHISSVKFLRLKKLMSEKSELCAPSIFFHSLFIIKLTSPVI